jgi:peptidoglycan/LPS O-acetylase OafA/YrhL
MELKSFVEINFIERLVRVFFKTMKFVCFIGLGCLVSYIYQGKIGKKTVILCGISLGILYLGYFVYAVKHIEQWKEILSYGLAYALFIGCYVVRDKFSKQGIMGHVGTISYSLYLVHGVPGFIMIYWMMSRDIKPLIATAGAIFYLLLVAKVFYWTVENNPIKRGLL